jgi:hypothetical protein
MLGGEGLGARRGLAADGGDLGVGGFLVRKDVEAGGSAGADDGGFEWLGGGGWGHEEMIPVGGSGDASVAKPDGDFAGLF